MSKDAQEACGRGNGQGSILSFPERGPWGNARYRGNCSGHVYKQIFEWLRPRVFTDPMVGSGTSVEVAREMGIEAYGFDLHSGFNVLKDSILEMVGNPSDLVLSHPPYHDCVVYSGSVWGREPHSDDLSRCATEQEFIEKLHRAVANQRTATRLAGFYGVIIGDVRKGGRYFSFQAEIIARMPKAELRSVLIKVQRNVGSNVTRYAPMRLPRIMHEYIVLWERTADRNDGASHEKTVSRSPGSTLRVPITADQCETSVNEFKEEQARIKIGKRIRTSVEFSGVPRGTAGTVTRYDCTGRPNAYTVGVSWDLERSTPLVDWFRKGEYDRFLVEL